MTLFPCNAYVALVCRVSSDIHMQPQSLNTFTVLVSLSHFQVPRRDEDWAESVGGDVGLLGCGQEGRVIWYVRAPLPLM